MSLVRHLILPVFLGGVLLSFGGCGGETFEGSGAGAMAGTGGSGTGGQGGSAGDGGSAGTAGRGGSTGGSGGSAGGSGGSTGGSGGSTGGSGGSTGGSGGLPPEWFACGKNSDCTVRENQCCQTCGPDTAGEAIAFNGAYSDQVAEQLCVGHTDPCPAVRCVLDPDWVLPFCIEGRCQAIDIRQDKLTSCGTEAQCRLRWGTGCCEACTQDPGMLVAVNNQIDYQATLCPEGVACPRCAISSYPANARALCGPDNHCSVGLLR